MVEAVVEETPTEEPQVEETPAEEPTEAQAEEPVQEEKPKPASSGATHTPKTDVDIDESGSLFDL